MSDPNLPDDPADQTPTNDPAGEGSDAASGGGNVTEQIEDLNIERELQDSYLTYAMSTIVDRALPDVRDGFKPSQRRIMVAMNDLNLGPRSKHLKCAKICGNTSGDYHPHGESVIYPTLVRLGQWWSNRYPMVHPQGNFGSTDGDPPAAMRYTEARMAPPAADMLEDLKLDTVDMIPNYDERVYEPTVLPSKFPNLPVNGSTGIAVGMACNLLPHNLNEICDGIVRVLNNPEISLGELMRDEVDDEGNVVRLGIKGPDFPTGGIVMGTDGIIEGYDSGRGKMTLRAKHHVEEGKTKSSIVIDELPYGVLRSSIVSAVAEAVKAGRITDVSSVNDESGRKHACRIVIDLKRGAEPDVVEQQIWQYTPAQVTVSMINIAIVGRRPRTLGLKALIENFIAHRKEVIVRRTRHLLKKAQQRGHILEGLIYAVCDIDEVVRLIRASKTREEAIEKLRRRGFQIPADHPYAPQIPQKLLDRAAAGDAEAGVRLSQTQAEAIGRLQLIQLVGLEIERLTKEYREVVEEIENYQYILAHDEAVIDIVREDTIEMKDKYGDARRTEISSIGVSNVSKEMLIQPEDMVVTLTRGGYIKRLPLDTYRAQGRGGRGIKGGTTKEDDVVDHLFVGNTHDYLLFFTNKGRVYSARVFDLPEMSRTSAGRSVAQLLEFQSGEKVAQMLSLESLEQAEAFLMFATKQGTVKRTALSAFANIRSNGIIAIGLNDDDELIGVEMTGGRDDVMLATRKGQAMRFTEDNVRAMGRPAAGVRGVKFKKKGDEVVSMVVLPEEGRDACQVLTACANGYGKRTVEAEYPTKNRGGMGVINIDATSRNGDVVGMQVVCSDDELMLITSAGIVIRQTVEAIRQTGRNAQGVKLIRLDKGDTLVGVAKVSIDEPNGDDDTPEASTEESSTPEATDSSESTSDDTASDE